jgi:probable HAF family extracellular repeat protein
MLRILGAVHMLRLDNLHLRVGVALVVGLGAFYTISAQTTPTFQGLGQMPGTMSGAGTYVNAVSGDGSTIVGYTWISGNATRPFRWTAAGGFEDLGQLGASASSNDRAYGVSFDGSAVVGQSNTLDQGPRAFRWVAGVGMQELPIYQALAVSSDGSVAAGMDIRWTAPGQIDQLGFLGGNNYTSAFGVSSDGQVVVGYSETSPSRYAHAFRWTSAGGIQDLGVTNGTESLAWGISGNGAVVFGEARDSGQFWRAFRWTSSLGMRDMGTLGGPMSTAHGASADGGVIVGKSLINSGSTSLRAFRWTAATGMRDLKQELINAGVSGLESWTLAVAADVSDDGKVIVGWGYPAPLTPAEPFIVVYPGAGGTGVTLSSLTLNPTTVTGGSPSTGTVTLSGAAPTGGQVVTLGTSHLSVATVPSSVTVAAGATSASFTVTTSTVETSTNVIISGASGGITKTADLTVSSGGGGGGGGDSGLRSPAANTANSGGDGNGFESSPANAHADDALSAVDNNSGTGSSTSCTSTFKDKHRFSNYGFTFPAGASVRGIEVRLDAKADSTSSSPKMCVQVSWDGGTTWTSTKSTPTLRTSMGTFTLGSATDTWGRSWTTGNLSEANFRVRVINVSSSSSRDFSLDWVAVRVHYQ